jgi:predicted PurR-regulated permease PerM
VLIGGACLVIILAGVKAAAPIVTLVLLALLLAQSIAPLPNWLMTKRLAPWLAVLITVLIVAIGGLAALSLLGASLAGLIDKLPAYQAKLTLLWNNLNVFLTARGMGISTLVPLDLVSPGQVIHLAGVLFNAIAQALGHGFVLLVIVILMLLEFAELRQASARKGRQTDSVWNRLEEIGLDTQTYVAITGLTGLAQAMLNILLLAILGVDFAVTWGALFFFVNFVPMFGLFIALVPPVLIALLDQGWQWALGVVIGWWGINLLFDNVVRPRFMKRGLDLSVLLIFLSLIFWSWLLGPAGAVLAVPLTLTVRRLAASLSAERTDAEEAGR